MDPWIVHVVLWTKFTIPSDLETGVISPEGKQLVQRYVSERFERDLGKDRVSKQLFPL